MTARVAKVPTAMSCPSCGYGKTYKTRALADAHFAKHSCAHQRELVARAARVKAAKTREGVKRDCECPVAKHEHGTSTAYVVDRCRCRACIDASTAASNVRSRAQVFGRYDSGRVDAEPVREHMRMLMVEGISLKRMSKLTGLSLSTVTATLYGRGERGHKPYARTSQGTATKLLALKPGLEHMAAGRVIDSTGTHRRLQALVTIGWSQSRLGERLSILPSNMVKLMASHQTTAGRARQVIALYDQLWNQPQTGHDQRSRISANRSKSYATTRGWAPPMAWDDATIDDPATTPNLGDPTNKTMARLENIEHMLRDGTAWWEIATRLGLTTTTLETFCYRNNRADLITTAKQDTRDYRRAS